MTLANVRKRSPWRAAACLLIVSICAPVSHAAPSPAAQAVAITGVTIIDVEHARALGPRTVLIEAGRIAAIATPRDARIPADALRVDGRGRFLIPGLVDMHVHLFNTFSHRTPNDWTFPLFIAQGVTAVREMNTNAAGIAVVDQWRREIGSGERIAPRILAAGIAVYGHSPGEAASDTDAAIRAGADFIKVFSEVPPAHWRAILEVAQARLVPVVGHVPAGVSLLDAAAAGQRSDEHLMQAYEACSSVETQLMNERKGLEGDALIERRDAQEARALDAFDAPRCARIGRKLAAAGQVQVPTLVLAHEESMRSDEVLSADPRWRYLRADERSRWQRALADPAAHADALAKKRWDVSRRIVSTFHSTGVTILAGTDAPMPGVYPGFALQEELELLVAAGLTPAQALHSATLAPAKFFGLSTMAGSVATGKIADLVLLDADPLLDIRNTRRIDAVLLGGHLLRRSDLDALLETAARAQREPSG